MVDPDTYDHLMHRNLWLHTLPDATTFEGAIEILGSGTPGRQRRRGARAPLRAIAVTAR